VSVSKSNQLRGRIWQRVGSSPPASASGFNESWHEGGHWVPVPIDDHLGRLPLHAVSVGDGPPLIVLHGYLQSSWAWRHNLDDFARRFQSHALCTPGFGWSAKPIGADYRLATQARRILAWMDRMDITQSHLVGSSLGGALALQVAAVAPQRVLSVALVNPAGPGWYPMASLSRLQHTLWSPLIRHLPGVSWGLRMGLRHIAYGDMPIDDEYMRHFLGPLQSPGGPEAALAVAMHFSADMEQLSRRTPGILCPLLMIRGNRDQVMPESAFRRIIDRLRQPQIVVMEGCGHCPMEEDPVRFNEVLWGFWSRIEAL